MDIREFWELTPKEFFIKVQAYQKRLRYREKMEIQTAYLSAYWNRVKKMPKLKDILDDDKPKEMTDKDMLEIVKQLNAKFGGEVNG